MHLSKLTLGIWMRLAVILVNSPLLRSVDLFVPSLGRVDVFGEVENSFSYEKILKAGDSKEYFWRGRMGDADSAVDRLWQKKKVEARQQ
ncbi:uncharacterized protein LOC114304030 isoform X1 [Camellia sinensis]|uniref:uncharacterized protein LOC114270746 isoform X2 n=1 Tax=Camellia sinensis TaxID=4442 RepID=UPI001035DB19|nr:uncharacterized protein LOC114270746 isoform X2 [Camellia sinensis]XP_028105014.1 uncharacterized protein LOC114304030 isoform X1 [Camellia sinensis]